MQKNEFQEKKIHNNAYTNAYKRANYTTVKVEIHKNTDLISRLETLQILTGKSRNSLIIQAISEMLDREKV